MASSSIASGFRTGLGSAFLQFIFERFASFGSFAWGEISIIWGVEEELRKLQRTFFKIQDLVDHVNSNPLRLHGGSNAWMLWFEDMRKLAYDADALLDHVSLHLSIYCAQHSVTSNHEKQVRPMVLSSITELNLPHDILEMQKKLDALAKEMEYLVMVEKAKFDARITSGISISSQFSTRNLHTSSFGVGRNFIGRAKDREVIVSFLGKECQSSNFSVMSVMGMSGIGKTSIASHVYDDRRVLGSFDLRIWVSVSADFDAVRITKSMIEYAEICACSLSDLGSLQHMLREKLRGKKFLLILDDYQSEKCDDWNVISWPFTSGSENSKVIMTTTSKKVASIVCSSEAHELEFFSDDDCWELIKQGAVKSAASTQNFESVGQQIARKCKGVPLVATTLGHMLRCKSTEEEWCSVLKDDLWDMPQDNNIFLRMIQSYLYLPAHLQRCFAYCSVFPQDYEFEMEQLIFLWVAEGFIQPKGARTLEDLAKDYFNDLCLRFFFQQYQNASHQIRYRMHGLIHDLARLVSKDICFHWKHDGSNCYPLFGNSCHFSLLHDSGQLLELKATVRNERLRTFLLMSNATTTQLDPQLFSHLKFLRVLGLGGVGLAVLVDSIDQLIYLRYLNLSENPISCLPKSMCKLAALQVLKLRGCSNLQVLPEEMSSLVSLRHLDLEKGMLKHMPPKLGKLTCLQYLSVYTVSKKNGCGITELKGLNCLQGSLCITDIDVSSEIEAREAELGLKTGLHKLELEWTSRGRHNPRLLSDTKFKQAQVLASLEPHNNLKELVIRNYYGMVYPAWLSNSSHHFTSIHLQGLKYCDHLPSLGELPFLAFFAISDMPCLESVDHNFYGTNNAEKFPALRSFEVCGLSKLTHWEYAGGTNANEIVMPALNFFTFHDCPLLSSLPRNLRSLLSSSQLKCERLSKPSAMALSRLVSFFTDEEANSCSQVFLSFLFTKILFRDGMNYI